MGALVDALAACTAAAPVPVASDPSIRAWSTNVACAGWAFWAAAAVAAAVPAAEAAVAALAALAALAGAVWVLVEASMVVVAAAPVLEASADVAATAPAVEADDCTTGFEDTTGVCGVGAAG